MRLRFAAVFPLCVLLAVPAAYGEQTFPYTAYINADNVYVRSGPGKNYYPTSKLHTGEKVEVYRHDPGGWYAIRPVEGSFTWVSGRYLKVGEDGLATTTADRVAARVGSEFSDIRDVIQVRLHRGEVLNVLGKKEFGSEPGSGTWYKVAPPSGEFRWVFGKFVDPNYHQSGVRKTPAGPSLLVGRPQPSTDQIAPAAKAADPQANGGHSAEQSAPDVQAGQQWLASTGRTEQRLDRAPTDAPRSTTAEADPVEPEATAGPTNQFVEPAHDPAGTVTLRRLSPEEFQAELEEIDVELSIMLAEEPTVWEFDELAVRSQALLTEAETAVERGKARLLANKIARSEQIKRRYDAVNDTRTLTDRHNRQLAELGQAREDASPELASAGRFDGAGRLARVAPPKLGAPRYALVDDKGDVRCYVTPAPGVNMNYYVGRRIGINGIRGYIAEQRAQHVMAKHITPLDGPLLR